MPQEIPEFMQRARRARDSLINRLIHYPDVVLIDIGLPPETTGNDMDKAEIVIRVHMREQWSMARPEERFDIPREIDGIRVIIISGDYHLE